MTVYLDDALRPVAGLEYVPNSMEARGKPLPVPPLPGVRNGLGLNQVAGFWSYTWTFNTMTHAEIQWWADLVDFDGDDFPTNLSKRFVQSAGLPAARLWNFDGKMTNFYTAVIDMPQWDFYQNGYFHNVVVKFSHMTHP